MSRISICVALILLSACTATQRQEAKTVVCHVCERVADYCQSGTPLTDAEKQAIIHELAADAGVGGGK